MPKLTGFPRVPIRGPQPLPLIGKFANILRFFGDPMGRMLALHRDFGDLVALNDGDPALICAFGAKHNREVITNSAVFQHDTDFPFQPPPGSALARTKVALPFLNGDVHRRHRRLMQPAFAKASLDGYRDDIIAIADAELRSWPVATVTDVTVLLRRLTVSIVLRCMFGLSPGARAEQMGGVMTQMLDVITSPALIAFPFRVPGTPFHKLNTLTEIFVAELDRLAEEKRRQPAGQKDVLALMLQAKDEDGTSLSADELIGEMNLLFSAGYDTTAQTLAWTLLLLAYHPRVLGELVEELDGVLGGNAPTVEQLPKLALLDRVIKESMRLLPVTPALFTRVLASDATLGPYTLPKSANVILSPFITHRAPELYPEPTRFRPERWADLSPTPYEYLPFGAGPRMCLGAGFANLSMRLMLPMILQRFRLSLASNVIIWCKVGGIVLAPKPGLPMQIVPQDRRFPPPPPVGGNIHDAVTLPC